MTPKPPEPLPPTIEALLAGERPLEPVPDLVRRRILTRARAVTSAAPSAVSFGGTQEASARSTSGLLRWAFAGVAMFAGAAGSWAAMRARRDAAPPAVGPVLAAARSVSPPSARLVVAPDEGLRPEPVAEAPALRRAVTVLPRPARERDPYALELRVLEPARAAVARGQFSSALSAIALHERRFPAGALAEEREALRVQALSGLGRNVEASRVAAAFRARFPGSVLLARMKIAAPRP